MYLQILWCVDYDDIVCFFHMVSSVCTISPGALGLNMKKNVESWNFQESYLDAHLTPWWKVPKNPSGGIFFLSKMAAVGAGRLLLYPKIM